MRQDLQQKLCDNYPEIFLREDSPPGGFYFECGDGWYPLIDFLCAMLLSDVDVIKHAIAAQTRALADPKSKNWPKWKKDTFTVERLEQTQQRLAQAQQLVPQAIQVKEKFGGLRIYVENSTEAQDQIISMVESLSLRVCEECGSMQDVITYTMNWHRSLCPRHADAQYGKEAVNFRQKTGQWIETQNEN